MQCQAKLEPWEVISEGGQSTGLIGETRCPRRAEATIEGKLVCRPHLAATLRRLRGETDPRQQWWEITMAEASGRCAFCGKALSELPRPQRDGEGGHAAAATTAFRPLPATRRGAPLEPGVLKRCGNRGGGSGSGRC